METNVLILLLVVQFSILVNCAVKLATPFRKFISSHHFPTRLNMNKLSNTEIDEMVKQRDAFRAVMKYKEADEIKMKLQAMHVEIKDISYKCEGNSAWQFKKAIVEEVETGLMELAHACYERLTNGEASEEDLCMKAKSFISMQGYGIDDAETDAETDPSRICSSSIAIPTVQKSSEMQGRKFADAAFEFSLAGIEDNTLYNQLANCCEQELLRFGHRKSCSSLQIIQMVEKLAVAGIKNHRIFDKAAILLSEKGFKSSLGPVTFDMFSGRALLWLWRHASKQKKPTKTTITSIHIISPEAPTENFIHTNKAAFSTTTSTAVSMGEDGVVLNKKVELPSFNSLFSDPTLPLVIDLGCGYGVSLLRLGDQDQHTKYTSNTYDTSNTNNTNNMNNAVVGLPGWCNLLGVDLNNRAIRYASGISKRWGHNHRTAFIYADCIEALHWVQRDYPGCVALIMVNFPTPYGIDAVLNRKFKSTECISDVVDNDDRCFSEIKTNSADNDRVALQLTEEVNISTETTRIAGNSQLPDGFNNFMVNLELINLTQAVLQKSTWPRPALLLQSNVEDVVVTMSNFVKLCAEEHSISNAQDKVLCTPMLSTLNMVVGDIRHNLCGINGNDPSMNANVNVNNAKNTDEETVELLQWRSYEELVRATDIHAGGGRISQRLQTWLDDIEANIINTNTNTVMNTVMNTDQNTDKNTDADILRGRDVRGRTRAFGQGWLARNPLPGNARTETEVHCEVEKQPVHRCVFVLQAQPLLSCS